MSELQTPTATFGDNRDTWRFATIASCVLLFISMAAHFGGPANAHASFPQTNQLARTQQQAAQSLTIGGFTTLNENPAFIILNEQGQRVGALPLQATESPTD